MGRKNKRYKKDLHQQAYEILVSKQAFGEPKREAKKDGTSHYKIFSYNTYKTYWKHIKYFIRWIKANHQECTTLHKAQKYVNVWLQVRVDQGLSASTIHTEAKALSKLYDIRPDDPQYFKPPLRKRENIKRSRNEAVNDKYFFRKENEEFIQFCQGVGGRRTAISKLKSNDLWLRKDMEETLRIEERGIGIIDDGGDTNLIKNIKDALETFPDQNVFVHFIKDKGGRSRFAPVIENVKQIIDRFNMTPTGKKVWEHMLGYSDIHSLRADYAASIYRKYARNVEKIPKNEKIMINGKLKSALYVCKKDAEGKVLDRLAMFKCSKALGHNRESVVANNYLYRL